MLRPKLVTVDNIVFLMRFEKLLYVFPATVFLTITTWLLLSYLHPIVPHNYTWSQPPVVEICDGVPIDTLNKAFTKIPVGKPMVIEQADLCLCEMGMNPLPGRVQVSLGVPQPEDPKDGIVRLGFTNRDFDPIDPSKLQSACVYLPHVGDVSEDEWVDVARHELAHAWGWDHAFVFVTHGFIEGRVSGKGNWGIPALGHVMTYSYSIAGHNVRGM